VSGTTIAVEPRASRQTGAAPPAPPVDRGDGGDWPPPSGPPPLDNARLGLLFFLGGETMLFAALVTGFLVLRVQSVVWPPPLQPRLPVLVTGINTLALLASSVFMVRGTRALWRGDSRGLGRGLLGAAILGAVFLLVQGYEWTRMIGFGLHVSSGAYGATFYTLIGAHALHVLGALTWLAAVLVGVRRGALGLARPTPVAVCATYWHYVVGLWPVLYVLVYLV
jgi:heme/copper-type cytochrome/quinol oxidase subunit 3